MQKRKYDPQLDVPDDDDDDADDVDCHDDDDDDESEDALGNFRPSLTECKLNKIFLAVCQQALREGSFAFHQALLALEKNLPGFQVSFNDDLLYLINSVPDSNLRCKPAKVCCLDDRSTGSRLSMGSSLLISTGCSCI